MATKIDVSHWTEMFKQKIEELMQSKVLLAILVSKISDRTEFKDNFSNYQSSICTEKKKV